jgi:hypothetical protein
VRLYCRYRPRGCDEVCDYDQFEEHAKECGRCRICERDSIIKKVMFNHHLEECDKFLFRCQFCGVEGTRAHLSQYHMCYQAFCGTKKGGQDFYIQKARLANMSAIKTFYE